MAVERKRWKDSVDMNVKGKAIVEIMLVGSKKNILAEEIRAGEAIKSIQILY